MLSKLKRSVAQWQFNAALSHVLQTPPLVRKPADLVFVSQLCHRDVLAYLLAMKTIYSQIGEGRIAIVDDGSLTPSDHQLLEDHCGAISFIDMDAVDTGRCPKGGTWERLITLIAQANTYGYAIQVDADLVALGPLDEVMNCYRDALPFAIGNVMRPGRVTFRQMSAWLAQTDFAGSGHVQVAAEHLLKTLPDADSRFYIRASSAFAGLPGGRVSLADLQALHDAMSPLLKTRWHEWGTEQFSSNIMIANAGDAVELTPPNYINHQLASDIRQARLVHFFGTWRFANGRYRACAQRAIAALNGST